MYSLLDRSVLIALGMVLSFFLGVVYITHDLESDVIEYLEQHGCFIEQSNVSGANP